jgi:hypothetical protein
MRRLIFLWLEQKKERNRKFGKLKNVILFCGQRIEGLVSFNTWFNAAADH